MNVVRKEKSYTIEDIYALPEGVRAELIDGQIYYMAAPTMIHQRLVIEISYRIRDYIGRKKGDCEVFPSPFAVFLNAEKEIYLEPDISVICDRDKITPEGCKGSPDWIIEITSPTSRPMDYYKKLLQYSTAGVKEYWIVDFEKNRIMVYDFQRDTVEEYTFLEKVKLYACRQRLDTSVICSGSHKNVGTGIWGFERRCRLHDKNTQVRKDIR